jgi:hypothetical protein
MGEGLHRAEGDDENGGRLNEQGDGVGNCLEVRVELDGRFPLS